MSNHNKRRERLIMPPQFLDSPSERPGFIWHSIPLFALFSCATIFLLGISCGLLAIIGPALPTVKLPLSNLTITWFGISVWLFIAAFLQSRDIQNRTALPGRGGNSPIGPWLMLIGGVVFLAVGVTSL